MEEMYYPVYRAIIEKHLKGIESIEFSKETNTITVVTKNVFCSVKKLEALRFDLFADDIEVGIVALTGRMAYNITLR